MAELQQKITDLVAEASREQALSPRALQEISDIVIEQDTLSKRTEKLAEKVVDLEGKLKDARGQVASIENREMNCGLREGEVDTREKEMLKLELRAEHQNQRVNDHVKMVELVFRNSVLKTSMYGSLPGRVSDGGILPQNVQIDETRETKQE